MLREGEILIDERTGVSVVRCMDFVVVRVPCDNDRDTWYLCQKQMPQGKRKRGRSLLQPRYSDSMEVDSPDSKPMLRVNLVPGIDLQSKKLLSD